MLLTEAVLTSTHNLCFEQKYEKNNQNFLSDFFFSFVCVKFSIYLNRRVFVIYPQEFCSTGDMDVPDSLSQ